MHACVAALELSMFTMASGMATSLCSIARVIHAIVRVQVSVWHGVSVGDERKEHASGPSSFLSRWSTQRRMRPSSS
eukprot:2791511-Pleurochrysis_carterae.AAC.7